MTAVGCGTFGLEGLTSPQAAITSRSGSESKGYVIPSLAEKAASLDDGSGLTAQISAPRCSNLLMFFCSSPSWPRQNGHQRPR